MVACESAFAAETKSTLSAWATSRADSCFKLVLSSASLETLALDALVANDFTKPAGSARVAAMLEARATTAGFSTAALTA
jgi:hypothetical protein